MLILQAFKRINECLSLGDFFRQILDLGLTMTISHNILEKLAMKPKKIYEVDIKETTETWVLKAPTHFSFRILLFNTESLFKYF